MQIKRQSLVIDIYNHLGWIGICEVIGIITINTVAATSFTDRSKPVAFSFYLVVSCPYNITCTKIQLHDYTIIIAAALSVLKGTYYQVTCIFQYSCCLVAVGAVKTFAPRHITIVIGFYYHSIG